jgi:hypothetical protein
MNPRSQACACSKHQEGRPRTNCLIPGFDGAFSSSSRERNDDRGDPSSDTAQESLRTLAKRHGINQKTVAKWKNRASVADLPRGPKQPTSTVLSIEEEAIVVAFRKHTLRLLDAVMAPV